MEEILSAICLLSGLVFMTSGIILANANLNDTAGKVVTVIMVITLIACVGSFLGLGFMALFKL